MTAFDSSSERHVMGVALHSGTRDYAAELVACEPSPPFRSMSRRHGRQSKRHTARLDQDTSCSARVVRWHTTTEAEANDFAGLALTNANGP